MGSIKGADVVTGQERERISRAFARVFVSCHSGVWGQGDRGDPVNAICVALRLHYLLDCFAMLAMTRGGLAMTRECGRYSFLVIARERSDRGDPVNAICVALRLHYLLDCFVSLAMTRECGRYSFLVIAREQCDRGDPVNAICVALRLHYLLDCFVSLAMTRECGRYSFLVILVCGGRATVAIQ